ncbi:hypothetical protein BX661DRAFT_180115 [Kickxella alabastrina]|uniref:uncharacterized protein n=1 Tax=Kickxella alabastrina TaxID=61397 RepID=UPI00221FA693|nr:uncharacterized protein BX661DRAFT_180115 [Kickxella alabastrina]KAI7830801.1 hypothetical protein BX661DRAFT_180115 [Kickxella alabastrina]KAJ1939798.1 hypothetical protein GGF37_004251 [Kickxella alabastrina]
MDEPKKHQQDNKPPLSDNANAAQPSSRPKRSRRPKSQPAAAAAPQQQQQSPLPAAAAVVQNKPTPRTALQKVKGSSGPADTRRLASPATTATAPAAVAKGKGTPMDTADRSAPLPASASKRRSRPKPKPAAATSTPAVAPAPSTTATPTTSTRPPVNARHRQPDASKDQSRAQRNPVQPNNNKRDARPNPPSSRGPSRGASRAPSPLQAMQPKAKQQQPKQNPRPPRVQQQDPKAQNTPGFKQFQSTLNTRKGQGSQTIQTTDDAQPTQVAQGAEIKHVPTSALPSGRLSTKVCVRWLPADLPEHVFWKTVEPALPWFDPADAGTTTQRQREILRATAPAGDISSSEEKTIDSDAITPSEDATEGPSEEPTTESSVPLPCMGLAPTSSITVDVYDSPALQRLDAPPYWRRFSPGKQHRSRAKPTDPSHAEIVFATPAEVDHFFRHYHGHAFAKNGSVSRAQVELAAFQYAPWSFDQSNAAADPLAGTLDTDPDFLAFLNPLPPKAEGEEVKPTLVHLSYAAAAAAKSATAANGSGADADAATPLINYLREIKRKTFGGASRMSMPASASSSSSIKSTVSTKPLVKLLAKPAVPPSRSGKGAAAAAAANSKPSAEHASLKRKSRRNR